MFSFQTEGFICNERSSNSVEIYQYEWAIPNLVIPDTVLNAGIRYNVIDFCPRKPLWAQSISFEHNQHIVRFFGQVINRNTKIITLPPKLETLPNDWFADSDNLEEIYISMENNNFVTLNKSILLNKDRTALYFVSRSDINEFVVPSTVTQIKKDSFKSTKIKSLIFPEDSQIESLDNIAISSKLVKLILPPKLKNISDNWCLDASNLSEIDISAENENFVVLNKSVLLNKDRTVLYYVSRSIAGEFIVPDTVTEIKKLAFYNSKIKSLIFPEDSQFESLDSNAISRTLVKLILPPKLKNISDDWCLDASNLSEIDISAENGKFSVINKTVLLDKKQKILYFVARTDENKIIIPTTIVFIKENALKDTPFEKNDALVQAAKQKLISKKMFQNLFFQIIRPTIPQEHITILNNSVYLSNNQKTLYKVNNEIEEIEIPKNVERINYNAFENSILKTIIFQEDSNIEHLQGFCFPKTLCKLILPPKLKILSNNCFNDSLELSEIDISPDNEHFIILNHLILLSKDQTVLHFVAHNNIDEIIIPDTVVKVLPNATRFTNLKRITFTNESENKSLSDFFVPKSLISLELPPKLKDIHSNWCLNATILKKIKLNNKNENFLVINDEYLYSIDQSVLYFVSRKPDISDFEVPASVKEISSNALKDTSIKSITFPDFSKMTVLNDYSIPKSVEILTLHSKLKEISNNCFRHADCLKSIYISMYNENFVFENDSVLYNKGRTIIYFVSRYNCKKIIIPNTVEVIKPYAFSKTQIKTIEFNNDSKLEKIESSSFQKCPYLKKIILPKLITTLPHKCFYSSGIEIIAFEGPLSLINLNDFENCSNLTRIIILNTCSLHIIGNAKLFSPKFKLLVKDGTELGRHELKDNQIKFISSCDTSLVTDIELAKNKKRQQNIKIYSLEEANKNETMHLNNFNEELEKQKNENKKLKNVFNKIMLKKIASKQKQIPLLNNDDILESNENDEFLGKNVTSKVIKKRMIFQRESSCNETYVLIKLISDEKIFTREKEILQTFQEHPCFSQICCYLLSENIEKYYHHIITKYYPSSLQNNILNLSNTEKAIIFVEILFGMRFLQERQQIIHRNIKPENILLTKNNHVKIGGFELATLSDLDLTLTLGVGSKNYMSPEILSNTDYSSSVDQYAVGKVLYYILTNGTLPPLNVNMINTRQFAIPKSVSKLGRKMIKKLCSLNPDHRPSFSQAFEELKENQYDLLPNINVSEIEERIMILEIKESFLLLDV